MPNLPRFHPLPTATQSSGSEWADRVVPQAQQTPAPLIYPESPWMPRVPDYDIRGRVYDPSDIMWRLLTPPNYQTEHATEAYEPIPLNPPPAQHTPNWYDFLMWWRR